MVALAGFASLGYLDDRTKIFKGSKGLSTWMKLTLQITQQVEDLPARWVRDGTEEVRHWVSVHLAIHVISNIAN